MDDEKETALMWETLAKKAMDVAPVSGREREGGRESEGGGGESKIYP